MFRSYLELLTTMFNNVFRNQQSVISIADYFQVILYSFSLIGTALILIGLLFGSFKFPRMFYNKLIKKTTNKINELMIKLKNEEDNEIELTKEIRELNKKLAKTTKIYICSIVFIYVPIVLPMLLIVLDIIFGKLR